MEYAGLPGFFEKFRWIAPLSNKKNEIEVFLEKLENVIIDKQRDLFSAKNGLTIILPNNFDEEEKIVNELISKNNQYTTNFSETSKFIKKKR